VGSDSKAGYLTDKCSIPRNHIFNSHDASFFTELMKITDGKGVDLVLNSLSGELLHESWKCVSEFGKMIELGKRDLAEFGKIALQPFLANRSFHCVQLSHMTTKAPEKVGR
jgi:NADPH:quinone reductase-like Zn-dependent oxidoreductase